MRLLMRWVGSGRGWLVFPLGTQRAQRGAKAQRRVLGEREAREELEGELVWVVCR